ncbi:ParB-like partition protein [Burkholderiales bacterium JOSHI_001]|nr:ParB-like partition protein [Burkholderiales bacterium JOSHI_001]
MTLKLDDLAALDAPSLNSPGLPMLVPVNAITEDPDQPRHEFDTNALQELAATIRERGVRQPISVRPHLQQAGRWLLNFGARRLRASILAGLTEIPAFIDTTADSYDQVLENEQREGLKPLELALFIQKRLARGESQSDIAKRLGKSRQWVTLATALIEAPDWLMDAYRQGRCRGLTELYELRRLHGDHPEHVQAWAGATDTITRERLVALKGELTERDAALVPAARPSATTPAAQDPAATSDEAPARATGQRVPRHQQTNQRIHVEFDGQDFQLVVSVAPLQGGHLYLRPLSGGPRRLAPAAAIKLRGFVGR